MKIVICALFSLVCSVLSANPMMVIVYELIENRTNVGTMETGIDNMQSREVLNHYTRLLQNVSTRDLMVRDTCIDPLNLPWLNNFINNPFDPYCSECLRLFQAKWNGDDVLIYEWDAGSCGFTDLGFTTIYSCSGDTVQHCNLSIAGLICDPDSMIRDDDLLGKELIWQCEPIHFPGCPAEVDILTMTWLQDTLEKYIDLCDAICIEGNSGNYLYRHMVDTNVILEFRTTCGDIVRRFFDCAGNTLYSCTEFGITTPSDCDLPFLPSLDDGEILWTCSTTSSRSIYSGTNAFKLYPTIVVDQVTMVTELQQRSEVTVYNGLGQVIQTITSLSSNEVISASDWPAGSIFIKIKSGGAPEVFKVIKVK